MNYNTNSRGQLTGVSRPGMQARFGSNGSISHAQFSRPGGAQMSCTHTARGGRQVVTVRSDHSRVVSYGAHSGYVERPMSRAGYVQRTYVYGGRSYVHVYHSYYYHGFGYFAYVPPIYYGPMFYGWAWNPWPAPIVFSWGWRSRPWFGLYAGYFAPFPVYPTASLWLTDYLLAQNLQAAYDGQQAAAAGAAQYGPPPTPDVSQNGAVMLSPEVKQAIAEEVRQQLAAERAAAAQSGSYNPPQVSPTSDQAPPALDPKQRIFVVSTSMDVATATGQNCALSGGDILLRTSDTLMSDGRVAVSVLSSKPGNCPINAGTAVEVAALQEMHNEFREQIDSGMQQLASNQGRNGLPPSPAPSPRQSPDGQGQPDLASAVDNLLAQQQQDATQAEAEVQQAANGVSN